MKWLLLLLLIGCGTIVSRAPLTIAEKRISNKLASECRYRLSDTDPMGSMVVYGPCSLWDVGDTLR